MATTDTSDFARKVIHVEKVTPGYWRATIDNPPLNLMDPEFDRDLEALVFAAEHDNDVRVIVFDTANTEYFLAHFDVSRAEEMLAIKTKSMLPVWPDLAWRMSQLHAVTIASIRGRARGVGSEFILACDMRFASEETAILAQPEVGLGLVPGGGALERLPWLVGRGRALEIVLGSEDFDAKLAERYGYVNRAIPDAELDAFVEKFARRIGSFSKQAVANAKKFINKNQPIPEPGALVTAEAIFYESANWPDTQARLEKAYKQGLNVPGKYEEKMGEELAK